MPFLRITLAVTGLAILYGILHDQVTARVCVEYFTIGHPKVIESEDPTLLALTWGVLATWWVGLPLGLMLGLAARVGPEPRLDLRQLIRPLLLGFLGVAIVATVAGFAGWNAAEAGEARLPTAMAERVPPDKHVAFHADWWAHLAAYAAAGVMGIAVLLYTVIRRIFLARKARGAAAA